jgi:hypothetical protein
MGAKVELKGSISKGILGYHSIMGGYTTLMSDIPILSEIGNNQFNLCDIILEWKRIFTFIRGESGIWRHSKGRLSHCHWI